MAAATIGAARIELSINSAEFEAQMKRARAAVGSFKASLNNVQRNFRSYGRSMKRIGDKVTQNIGLPIAAIGALSGKAAVDFESAFTGVRKTVNATEQEFASIREEILNMSTEIPVAANEISGIAEAAGQLGIQTDNLMSFTRVMADLGVATNMTSDEAATALARLANITQMSQQDFDKLGSTVVDLGNNLATTESEIVEMAQRLAGSANEAGLAESEILAFAGALSSVGISAEAGGSSFSKVFDEINLAVQTGSSQLNSFARVAQMSTSQFSEAFQQNAAGAVLSFVEGLGKMEQRGGSAIATLEDMGITERRMRDALLRAANAGDLFREAGELATKAWGDNIALSKEAAQRYDTAASKIKLMYNEIFKMGVAIGDALTPAISKARELVHDFRLAFEGMSDSTRNAVMVVAGLLGASGPIIAALGTLTVALGSISWPVVLGVTAVAGAASAIISHWDSVVAYFTTGEGAELWATVKAVASSTFDSILGIVQSFIGAAERFWDTFGGTIIEITEFGFSEVARVIQTTLDILSTAIDVVTLRMLTDWDGFLNDMEERTSRWVDNMGGMIMDFIELGSYIGNSIGEGVANASTDFAKWVLDTEQTVTNSFMNMQSPINGFFDQFEQGAGVFKTNAQQMLDDLVALQQFINTDWSMPNFNQGGQGGQKSGGATWGANPYFLQDGLNPIEPDNIQAAQNSIADLSTNYQQNLADMTVAVSNFKSASEAGLTGSLGAWQEFVVDFQESGRKFKNFMISQVAGAITKFSEMIGVSMAGAGNSFKTAFEKIILIAVDFAKQLGQLLIGMGSAIVIAPGLQGPAGAYIAAGSALVALASGVSAGIEKRASNRQQRAQEASQSGGRMPALANGGVIYGPTQAVLGDNRDVGVNPEVVGPLSDVQRLVGGNQTVNVRGRFRIEGSDLVAIIDEQGYKDRR